MKNGNDIVDIFAQVLQNNETEPSDLNCLVREYIFAGSKNEQSQNLHDLLYGLMKYDICERMVSLLLKSLLAIDNYDRSLVNTCQNSDKTVLECTGSGKKPFKTLNISTPSIITAVAAGAKIIKKGSHGTSSLLGSADILKILGFKSPLNSEAQNNLLEKTGFTFVNIENVIPNFNAIYSGYYFHPHLLSYVLGASVTSLRGNKVLYGLSLPNVCFSAKSISYLVDEEKITVYSSITENGKCFDEILGSGYIYVSRCENEKISTHRFDMTKHPYGYDQLLAPLSISESIHATVDALQGKGIPSYVDAIKINAAFFLLESGIIKDLKTGIILTDEILNNGQALFTLKKIIRDSGGQLNAKYL